MSDPTPNGRAHFDIFELDFEALALRRSGERVRLAPQAFRLLVLLASNPGKLVTREQIQSHIWGDNTFVDFEHSINKAIRQIRDALRDNAGAPKFIETVPRLGYRFLPVVTTIGTALESGRAEHAPPVWQSGEGRGVAGRLGARFWWICAIMSAGMVAVAGRVVLRLDVASEGAWKVEALSALRGTQVFPALSPDGRKIAFIWTGNPSSHPDLYVMTIGGSDLTRLTDDEAAECYPAWSPDGKWIAFEHCNPGGLDGYIAGSAPVYVIPSAGGGKRQVAEVRAPTDHYLPQLAWTRDNQWLVLRNREAASDRIGLFLLSLASGERRQITAPTGASSDDAAPAISPDGRFLAFTRSTFPQVRDVYLLPLGTGGLPAGAARRLTHVADDITGIFWIDGGSRILYVSGGPRAFFSVVSSEGGTPRRMPAPDAAAAQVSSSADGRLFAYTNGYLDTDIWRIPVPGTSTRPARLISSARWDVSPDFSPDGSRIAFASDRSGAMEIWISASDGSAPVRLTYYGAESGSPRWSPDGTEIAFDLTEHGNADIYVISSNGGQPRRLTFDASDERLPSWSRDGKTIYFTSNRTGTQEIWRIAALGGQAAQVTHNGGLLAFESRDRKDLYYARRFLRPYSVFRLPLAGGEEERVIETIKGWPTFRVVSDGIYFAPDSPPRTLSFYDFATRHIRTLGNLVQDLGMGFAFSPDRKSLLVAPAEFRGGELFVLSRKAGSPIPPRKTE